jgi:hypothetical protein
MNEDKVLFYERIHRAAVAVMATTRQIRPEKVILYMGHSGYWDTLAPQAVATVAQNADLLNRAVTGLLRGWTTTSIESHLCLLGTSNWTTGGIPAIVQVLNGADLRETHLKLVVLTGAGHAGKM